MVSAIRVIVEGDTDSLTEALDAGTEAVNDFGSGLVSLEGRTISYDEVIKRLGKTATKSEQELLDFMSQKEEMDFNKFIEGTQEATTTLQGFLQGFLDGDRTMKSFLKGLTGLTRGIFAVTAAWAAGRAIKDFIQDSIEAARAAGIAAKGLDTLETSVDELKVSIGTELIAAFDKTAGALGGFVQHTAEALAINRKLKELFDAGKISQDQYRKSTIMMVDWQDRFATSSRLVNDLIDEQAEVIGVAIEATDGWRGNLDEVTLRTTLWEIAQARLNAELDALRGKMVPLTGDIENFQKTIEDLEQAAADIDAEFGLLTFITPAQVAEVGGLKSQLTGVWIAYLDIIDVIEDDNLGSKGLAAAEEEAEDLLGQIGNLEFQIRELGGIPYITQEQEADAREALKDIEESIESVTAAWTRQTNMMVFDLAQQQFAVGGLTDAEVDALTALAGGLGLIDPAQVALLDRIAEISATFSVSGDVGQFTQDMAAIASMIADPDFQLDDLIGDTTDLQVVDELVTGVAEGLGTIDEIDVTPGIDKTPLEEADEVVEDILGNLAAIEAKVWRTVVEIELQLTGATTSGTGGATASGGGAFQGVPVIVGDGGVPELFVPSQSGLITPIGPGANVGNNYKQFFSAPITINVEGGSLSDILSEPLVG